MDVLVRTPLGASGRLWRLGIWITSLRCDRPARVTRLRCVLGRPLGPLPRLLAIVAGVARIGRIEQMRRLVPRQATILLITPRLTDTGTSQPCADIQPVRTIGLQRAAFTFAWLILIARWFVWPSRSGLRRFGTRWERPDLGALWAAITLSTL